MICKSKPMKLTDFDRQILGEMRIAGLPSDLDLLDPGKRRYRLSRAGYCVYDEHVERRWGYHYWHLTQKGEDAIATKETDK